MWMRVLGGSGPSCIAFRFVADQRPPRYHHHTRKKHDPNKKEPKSITQRAKQAAPHEDGYG